MLLCSFSLFGLTPKKPINQNKEKKILEIIVNTLKKKHLISKNIDDNFSKKMFKTYIDSLDRNRLFLLQSDIKEFKKYETKLDDQINKNDLSFFYMTYDRLLIRMKESKEIYTNLLKNGLEFESDQEATNFYNSGEIINKSNVFHKNKAELSKRWYGYLKTINIGLLKSLIIEKSSEQISQVEFKSNLNNCSQIIGKRLESTLLNFDNINRDLIFEYYLNSLIVQFDVHSKYFIPATRDKYLFKETGKLEGSGITVNLVNDFIEVKSLMDGGPAWKTKKIEKGDVILKIQQENEEPENVVGYSIYNVSKLLKGKAGTIVKLTIKKPDGKLETVAIKREIVSTNDSFIKSCLVTKNKVKYAIVSFPRFYVDFDDDQLRNVVDDFEEELQILKQSDVQGIILDMRNNGGGSVEAAVKIIGNFINKNPVLQFKNKENKTTLFESENTQKKWDKSIVLIVNNKTASASEIFASAFQEYNIGIIIGSQTFGKGTVQEFIDLNSFNSKKEEKDDFGLLKITVNKFYKLNGKSVQKNGIIPDVIFETNNKLERESLIKDALNADQVNAIEINPNNNLNHFSKIINSCKTRFISNDNLKLDFINSITSKKIETDLLELKSLNADKLLNQINDLIKKHNALKEIKSNELEFSSTAADLKMLKRKDYLFQKRKIWHENLTKDFQIEEGLNILEDLYILKN